MSEKIALKKVGDLGVCAYLMMHGYKIHEKKDKAFYFLLQESEVKDFEDKQMEYLSSEFHRFDSYIMSLKKMNGSYN